MTQPKSEQAGIDLPANGDFDLVLILSGGNALGAFQAGVYEALHQHRLYPSWVIGASIGAINGALITGADPDKRIEALRTFWRTKGRESDLLQSPWRSAAHETMRRTAAVGWTMMAGRPGIFSPLLSSLLPWTADRPSLFETDELATTLDQMVDFDCLNAGRCRFTAAAVDLATGDDVVFDSADGPIDARHVRASAALPVSFPPVEIDGRWLVDGGVSANLPLDPFFADPPARPVICLAVDLLPLTQTLPHTLGETASRMQDLIFAAQSRRSIERWRGVYAGREDISITFVRLAYTSQALEVAGKAMDFSTATIAQRWLAGHSAAGDVIDRIEKGGIVVAQAGLHIVAA